MQIETFPLSQARDITARNGSLLEPRPPRCRICCALSTFFIIYYLAELTFSVLALYMVYTVSPNSILYELLCTIVL